MKRVRTTCLKCALLLAFVVSLFPIPVVKAKPTGGEPYPCQHCACGCSSAEQCWRSCCCFNDQQKLAWAKKNGVKPPDWFIAKAPDPEKSVAKACCTNHTNKSCCSSKSSTPTTLKPSCCTAKTESSPKTSANASKNSGRRWIVLDDALRCKGLSLTLDKGIFKLPMQRAEAMLAVSSEALFCPRVCLTSSVGLLPPTPPPRG
jgi:hypothetical protein